MPGRNSCPTSLRFSEKSSTCYTETQFPTKIGPQSHTCSCVSEVQPWSCYHIPDQAQRRNRALLELTKPLVTEGMHLLLLCEVVCGRRKDRALTTVRPEVQGQCWTQVQPSPPAPPSPRPPRSSRGCPSAPGTYHTFWERPQCPCTGCSLCLQCSSSCSSGDSF